MKATRIACCLVLAMFLPAWSLAGQKQVPAAAGRHPGHQAESSLQEPLTVDRAVERALSNNHLIRAAAERSRAAVEALGTARSDFYPKLVGTYRYTRLGQEPFMYWNAYVVNPATGTITGTRQVEAPVGTLDNFHWDISLIQPLFTGFALQSRYAMAKTGKALGRVSLARARADIVCQVKVAFSRALLTEKLVLISEAAEKSLRAHAEKARAFFDQGLIPYNDLLQAQVALSEATQQKVEARARAEVAKAALVNLLALDDDQSLKLAELSEDLAAPPEPDELISMAAASRPELEALRLAVRKVELAIDMVNSSNYPQLSLVASYGQDGRNWRATDNPHRNSYNSSISIQARWTLFEGGKTRSEQARLKHEKKALLQQQENARRAIALEIKDALARVKTARTNVDTARQALAKARENLRITKLRYDQQMATSTDVLDASTRLTRARVGFFRAIYGFHAARAELERAVGKSPQTRSEDHAG